jgi:hypothetical protein
VAARDGGPLPKGRHRSSAEEDGEEAKAGGEEREQAEVGPEARGDAEISRRPACGPCLIRTRGPQGCAAAMMIGSLFLGRQYEL